MEPRNRSELQLEAHGMTNNITLISGSLVKEMAEIEPKIKGARLDRVGTLGVMLQLEKRGRTRLRFWEIKLLRFLHIPCVRGTITDNVATG